MTDPIVLCRHLSKRYGGRAALADLDLEVRRGECVGLVGPNGAGKSTLFKTLLGICRLDGGEAFVGGIPVRTDARRVREQVGSLPGDLGLWRRRTGEETLRFLLSFHPHARPQIARSIARRFGLPVERRVKTYSTGMRQQLGVAQALALGTPVLFLDEPSKGLDPTAREVFRDLLEEQRDAGRTILLSSHRLDEIEEIADRLVFLDRGRRVPDEAIEEARARLARRIEVTFGPVDGADRERALRALPEVEEVERIRYGYALTLRSGADGRRVLANLAALPIASVRWNRPSLYEIYRELYRPLDRRKESPS